MRTSPRDGARTRRWSSHGDGTTTRLAGTRDPWWGARRPHRRRAHPEWDVLGAIASGGALGGLARWAIENAFGARPDAFPWATFVINVSGAFVLSALLVLFVDVFPPSRYARPFVGVGFLGAYTTFSTWMIEAAQLISHGSARLGLGYLLASMLAGLAAVWLGLIVGKAVVLRSSAPAAEED